MLQNLNVSKVSFYHPKSPSAHSFLVESQGTIDKEEGSQKTVDLLEKTLISQITSKYNSPRCINDSSQRLKVDIIVRSEKVIPEWKTFNKNRKFKMNKNCNVFYHKGLKE